MKWCHESLTTVHMAPTISAVSLFALILMMAATSSPGFPKGSRGWEISQKSSSIGRPLSVCNGKFQFVQICNWLFFCVVYFSNRLKHQEKYNIVNIKVVQSMVTVLPYIDMYLYTRTREQARERESYIWTLNFLFYCCIFPNGRRFSFQN